MTYRRRPVFAMLAVVFCLSFLFAPAAPGADGSGEVPVKVSADLQALGVKAATTAAIQEPKAAVIGSSGPTATVFVTFDKPLYGALHLRGYDRDNTEVARSARENVRKNADDGGHIQFTFDAPTNLAKVTRFSLMGEIRESAGKPPRKESIGEEARSIVKELLE